jgi:hypothetical protein
MTKIEDLIELTNNSIGHFYENIPALYSGDGILLYKTDDNIWKACPNDGTPWADKKWEILYKAEILNYINKNNLDMSAFHATLLSKLSTEYYYMERRMQDIEKVIDDKTLKKAKQALEKFGEAILQALENTKKDLNKKKFKVIK